MNMGGWILMILSWGAIISVAIFCFSTMFKVERKGK
jgi:hypothetical protein